MFEIYKSVTEIFWDNERLSLVNKTFSTKKLVNFIPHEDSYYTFGSWAPVNSVMELSFTRCDEKRYLWLGGDRTHDFRIRPTVSLLTELRVDTKQLWRVYDITPLSHVSGYFLKRRFFFVQTSFYIVSFFTNGWTETEDLEYDDFVNHNIIIRLTLRRLYKGCYRISEC